MLTLFCLSHLSVSQDPSGRAPLHRQSCAWHAPRRQLAQFHPVATARHGQSHGFPTHAAATADAVALLPFTSSTLPFCRSCLFVHGSLRPVHALACCLSRSLFAHSAFSIALPMQFVYGVISSKRVSTLPGDQTCKIVDYYSLSLQAHWVTVRYSIMPVPHHESIVRRRCLFLSSSPLHLRPSIAFETTPTFPRLLKSVTSRPLD